MKFSAKQIFSPFLSLALAFSVSSTALAADGQVRITGTVSAAACTVNSVNKWESSAGTVDFGSVSLKTFNAAGSSSGSVPFTITLKDCNVPSPPKITFSGTAVTVENYTNLFSSGLNGIGIKIVDANNLSTIYTPNISTQNSGLNAMTSTEVSTASANFLAYLQSYNTSAQAGKIDTTINFVIDYP